MSIPSVGAPGRTVTGPSTRLLIALEGKVRVDVEPLSVGTALTELPASSQTETRQYVGIVMAEAKVTTSEASVPTPIAEVDPVTSSAV